MNKIALTLVAGVAFASSAIAQGTVTLNNRVAGIVDFKVTAADMVTGLAGTGFSAQLYAGADAGSLAPVAGSVTVFRTGNAAGYIVSLGDISIPGLAGGSSVSLQLRAWDNAGGTITSYDNALVRGSSLPINNVVLGGAGSPPSTAASLAGMTTFAIVPIPEPGVMSLAALGGLGLIALRRKNS